MGIPRSSMKQGCSLGNGKALVLLGVDESLFLILFTFLIYRSIILVKIVIKIICCKENFDGKKKSL